MLCTYIIYIYIYYTDEIYIYYVLKYYTGYITIYIYIQYIGDHLQCLTFPVRLVIPQRGIHLADENLAIPQVSQGS
jgi:hypothetical protein